VIERFFNTENRKDLPTTKVTPTKIEKLHRERAEVKTESRGSKKC